MTRNDLIHAVLTGDLVKSSMLTSEKSTGAMELLKHAAMTFAEQYPDTIVGEMDTFRHDSWQLLIKQPAMAFRAAVFLRSALKLESDAETKFDTRICIGIGLVERIDIQRISNSRGSAFTRSGKGLDSMDRECLMLVTGNGTPALLNGLAGTAVPLLDCVISDWTPTESRAVYGALNGWTQEKTAAKWPVHEKIGKQPTRQAIGDSLRRAHWHAVNSVLLWIETNTLQAYELDKCL